MHCLFVSQQIKIPDPQSAIVRSADKLLVKFHPAQSVNGSFVPVQFQGITAATAGKGWVYPPGENGAKSGPRKYIHRLPVLSPVQLHAVK
eukprot:scaffold370_cov349-Pavlova_lutheri.AAC.16